MITSDKAIEPRYVTPEEASRRMGGVLAPKTIRNKVHAGQFTAEHGIRKICGRIAIEWELFESTVVKRVGEL